MALLSRRSLEGYLLIDHRDSPGITVDDAIKAGLNPAHVPAVGKGQVYESATLQCSHCDAIVILNPLRTRARHNCPYCDHYVCDRPACVLMTTGKVPHRPMQQVFDEAQQAAVIADRLTL